MVSASYVHEQNHTVLPPAENLLRKLSQLMPHHIFGDSELVVRLPIMHLKPMAYKVRHNRTTSRLGLDRRHTLARLWRRHRDR